MGISDTGGPGPAPNSVIGTRVVSGVEISDFAVENPDARSRDARGSEITAEGVTGAAANIGFDAVVVDTGSEEGWKPVSEYGAGRRPRKYSYE